MKKALALILALVMVFALCACGTAAETPAAPETPAEQPAADTPVEGELPYKGQTLYVANWQAYNSDEDYCVKAFEDKFGCKVEHVYYNSYDELMTTLQTGGNATIDCVMVSQNYTQYFKDLGLIMNVDPAKIPNYANVADTYKDIYPYAVDDQGNTFAFPWCSGVSSLVYNPDYVDFQIKHWSDLLDPSLAGHVCMYGDYGDGMIIGALMSGQDPTQPETLDLGKVSEALAKLKPQILSFWASSDEQLMPYYAGESWAGNMWSGPYAKLQQEGKSIVLVHPEEGTVGYVDYWCIVEGTDQFDLACEWINWIESTEEQTSMATGISENYPPEEGSVYPTYSPVIQEVINSLTEAQKDALGLNPAPTKICMLNYLTAEQKDAWVDCWESFKASVG